MRIVFMGGKPIGEKVLGYLRRQGEDKIWAYSSNVHFDNICFPCELDLIISVHYDYILPKKIIDLPKLGCINLHLADTEVYRGCYPMTRAILDGATKYGVTIHKIDEGIDTGDILARDVFSISNDLTSEELYWYATKRGYHLFASFWSYFKQGKIGKSKQCIKGEYMQRKFPDQQILVTEQEKRKILAFTFEGYPPPYINIKGRRFKIVEDEDSPS